MSNYFEKLKNPRWQEKRLEIMKRSKFSCEWCGAKDFTLHVHHGYYTGGNDPWDYGDDTLYCLCEHCHTEAESYKHDIHLEVARIHPKYHRELFYAILGLKEQIAAGSVQCEDMDWEA